MYFSFYAVILQDEVTVIEDEQTSKKQHTVSDEDSVTAEGDEESIKDVSG